MNTNATPIARRRFVKLSAGAAGLAAAGILGGCSSPAPANNAANGTRPEGGGRGKHGPKFHEAMNKVHVVDSAPDDSEALAKFIVVSDIHLNVEWTPYIDRARKMFEDIAEFCPDNDAIIVNGDITDHGRLEEWELFANLAEASGFKYPDDLVLVIGNHDQYDSSEGARAVSNLTDQFRAQIGIDDQVHPYYDREINGVHLIMLGPDSYPEDNWAHFGISNEQVDWMDKLVSEDEANGTISLVFLHEPLYQTVRMTEPGDFGHMWSLSDEDNNNLHAHIRRHPNLVFFSGHTHALPDTVQLEHDAPLYVGTGSIAYCIDDIDEDDAMGNGDDETYAALGWEVTIWDTHIRFRMRDFRNRTYWDSFSTIYEF